MKILYFDFSMGAAGDMLTASLSELIEDRERFVAYLNSAGIPGVEFSCEDSVKCGIKGTHMSVKINGEEEEEHSHHHHHGHGMESITETIGSLNIPEKVKADAINVYNLIADAESKVHGKPVTEIHFHEVGTIDAVADVVAFCSAVNELSPDRIYASPVNTGSGTVECAHGILPVPAPATAELLKGIPSYSDGINGELCTPTGAALIKYFADEFGPMPLMIPEKTGYGMGTRDFERANCVRVISGSDGKSGDFATELVCNIDDMTAEEIGYASQVLLEEGALDVYTIPAGMKKNRPGVLFCVLCGESEKDRFVKAVFKHTSTIGIREHTCRRYVLDRTEGTVLTRYGEVGIKKSSGYGCSKVKPEYDDVSRIASEQGMSYREVLEEISPENSD